MPQDYVARYMMQSSKKFCFYHQVVTGNGGYIFKTALLAEMEKRPRILAVGSSRVMKLYQAMFSQPFLNMGRVMSNVSEARQFFLHLPKMEKLPHTMIIGLDFWWFSRYKKEKVKKVRIDPSTLWMLQRAAKKIYGRAANWKYILYIAKNPSCNFGVEAKNKNIGFLSDGSFIYPYPFYKMKFLDENFQDTRNRIEEKTDIFWLPEGGPNRKKMDIFISLVKELERKGVYVVVYIPPVAPTIHDLMKKKGHNDFVRKIYQYFKGHGVNIYNFHNPAIIGSGDCEFIDGYHPGDVTNARLLKKLANSEPRLKKVLNMHFIDKMIEYYAGNASSLYSTIFHMQERDFLKIGCKKRPPAPKWWSKESEYNLLHPLRDKPN